MKLTTLFFVISLESIAAHGYSQTENITVKMKDSNLKEFFNTIEKQTSYKFLYRDDAVEGIKVNIDETDKPLDNILNDILNESEFSFKLMPNNLIVIAPMELLQQVVITGTVTDNQGAPLTGVTIIVKGSTIGTISDASGKYSLSNVPQNATIVFSFVGMVTQEIPLNSRVKIDVIMAESAIGLEEVVVIGYGTTKKVTLTGAVAAINSKDIRSTSSDNLSNQLQGKLPGLRVTQRSGEPGAFTTVYDIRGLGTPLIVVDGMVMDGTDFVRLNPDDIDQVTILKDASAAIYGVKAANGVILVTTKRGDIGKPKITYTGSFTRSNFTNFPESCNAYQFAWLTTQNEINSGRAPTATTYSAADLEKFKDGTYPSTNWFDEVMGKYATSLKHNINISGGSDRVKYFTSIGNISEMGIWKSRDLTYKKNNVRVFVTGKITDNLEAEISMEGMMDNRNRAGNTTDIVETIWVHSLPTLPVYANNNPAYLQEQAVGGHHALAEMSSSYSGYILTKNETFQGIFTLKYKVPFVKGLDARFMYGYYFMDQYTKQWKEAFKLYKYDSVTDTYNNTSTVNSPSTLSGTYSPSNRSSLQAQLNYSKVFLEKHSMKASLIFEERHDISDNLRATKQFDIDIDQFYAGIANPTVTSSNIVENDNQSVIGRLNYDYLTKYLFEAGFNYNGSSKFPEGKRWGFFPYASAGWRISEEGFFKSNLPFITNLKFRGSWGIMGDDAASSFQFLTGYTYPSGNYVFSNKVISNLGFRGIPNPNITWYTVNTKNIGIDASIKNGLINLQFDLFRRDRSGLLATRILTVPSTVGATLPQENLNKDMREGFELVLGQSRKFTYLYYDISASVTYTRGQNTQLQRTPDGNSYLNYMNNTTDRWNNMAWGYNYIGQFQSQDDLNNSPIQDSRGNTTLKPGDYKYEDVNGDGLITTLDRIPIARGTIPDITFTFNASISYRQFDLNILFQGASNYNHSRESFIRYALPYNRNCFDTFTDCWHHEDIYDINSPWIPGKYASPTTGGTPPSNSWDSQLWVQDAKYLRLKSLEVGYTLNKSLLSKLFMQDLRIYVSGFNLFTLSKLKYFDPETLQDRLYPIMRDLTVGLNVTF